MLRRLSILTLAVSCLAAPALAEEGGPLREALRAKLKARMLEKMVEKGEETPATPLTQNITAPGDYSFRITHDGIERMYNVHVPPGYRPGRDTPLLFAFHGGGGDMEYMAREEHYGLSSFFDSKGYVLVYVNGYSNFASGKLATWNAGKCCGDARDKDIDDVGFVREIVNHLTQRMSVDRNRIYATGMSNGGMISYRLACEMADVFRAIAPVAGTDGTVSCNPSQPVSVLHIHAQNDTHVLFNGGAGKDVFKDKSKVTEFRGVPQTFELWADHNNCTGRPERVLNKAGAYCDLYRNCAQGSQVKLCVTETGGHSWPGAPKPGGIRKKEPTSKALSANEEMWAFFESLN